MEAWWLMWFDREDCDCCLYYFWTKQQRDLVASMMNMAITIADVCCSDNNDTRFMLALSSEMKTLDGAKEMADAVEAEPYYWHQTPKERRGGSNEADR